MDIQNDNRPQPVREVTAQRLGFPPATASDVQRVFGNDNLMGFDMQAMCEKAGVQAQFDTNGVMPYSSEELERAKGYSDSVVVRTPSSLRFTDNNGEYNGPVTLRAVLRLRELLRNSPLGKQIPSRDGTLTDLELIGLAEQGKLDEAISPGCSVVKKNAFSIPPSTDEKEKDALLSLHYNDLGGATVQPVGRDLWNDLAYWLATGKTQPAGIKPTLFRPFQPMVSKP